VWLFDARNRCFGTFSTFLTCIAAASGKIAVSYETPPDEKVENSKWYDRIQKTDNAIEAQTDKALLLNVVMTCDDAKTKDPTTEMKL